MTQPKLVIFGQVIRFVLLATFFSVPITAVATTPLIDSVEFEGQTLKIFPVKRTWLELPSSEKLDELRRQQRCTAIGGPRAKWKIVENRLWLVGLFQCGGAISLESVYGGTGEPILAEWVSEIVIAREGKGLCRSISFDIGISEFTTAFEFENGILKRVERTNNRSNPAVPTEEDLKKMGLSEKDAKEHVAWGLWPCLSHKEQEALRDAKAPIRDATTR